MSTFYDSYMCTNRIDSWGDSIICGVENGIWYYDYGYSEVFGPISGCWADTDGLAICGDY